jgi:hypothetical protein
MRLREFIAGLGTAAAWPVVARAQQPLVPAPLEGAANRVIVGRLVFLIFLLEVLR